MLPPAGRVDGAVVCWQCTRGRGGGALSKGTRGVGIEPRRTQRTRREEREMEDLRQRTRRNTDEDEEGEGREQTRGKEEVEGDGWAQAGEIVECRGQHCRFCRFSILILVLI